MTPEIRKKTPLEVYRELAANVTDAVYEGIYTMPELGRMADRAFQYERAWEKQQESQE